jgi:hypothetical protein
MTAFAVGITLVALSLGSQIRPALADSPPKLNAGPSCDAAVLGAISLGREKEAGMGDEHEAEDVLTRNWSQYTRAHKTQCVGMTSRGGSAELCGIDLLSRDHE